jgi:hypothetical protein
MYTLLDHLREHAALRYMEIPMLHQIHMLHPHMTGEKMTCIGGIMQNGIDDLDGNTTRGSGVVIVEGGSEMMEHEVGRLDMTTIAVTADIEQMTDLHETLLNAIVGGGLVLQSPHHVVLVSI